MSFNGPWSWYKRVDVDQWSWSLLDHGPGPNWSVVLVNGGLLYKSIDIVYAGPGIWSWFILVVVFIVGQES